MNRWLSLLLRDWQYYALHKGQWGLPLLYFLMICCFFPMAFDLTEVNLQMLGVGVIWMAAMLASLLSLEGLFRQDIEHGVFWHYLLSPMNMLGILYMKILAHWLCFSVPLIVATIFIGVLFGLPWHALSILLIALLLGTPALTLIGWFGLSIIASLPRGGLLLALVVMPLYLPVLILGSISTQYALEGLSVLGPLAIMLAFLIFTAMLLPWVSLQSIKLSLSS